MISATWNAPRETFDNPNSILFAGMGTAELFLAITSNYKFTGYEILPAFGVYDIFKSSSDIPAALEEYKPPATFLLAQTGTYAGARLTTRSIVAFGHSIGSNCTPADFLRLVNIIQ